MADKKTPAEVLEERAKARKTKIEDRKKKEIKEGFLNPFNEGTSYAEFLKEVNSSKKELEDYCKGKLSDEQITWLKTEIEHFENKNKN